MKNYDVILVGGGAAGFFTAINIAENNRKLKIAILERGKETLSKVRISGGGRCNVTHHCFDSLELTKFYPRGNKELKGPFKVFSAQDTVDWFKKRGVVLKTEEDNRMFPSTDSSQTIIDCFLNATEKLKIDILTSQSVQSIFKKDVSWHIETQNEKYACQDLILTTGSNPKMWEMIEGLGHKIIEPVPSLFTFNVKDNRIKDLMGLATPASVKINGTNLKENGPLLITHWGMSGPAIIKLSAWGARSLNEVNYNFDITVNWLDEISFDECMITLKKIKETEAKKLVKNRKAFEIPTRLWERLIDHCQIDEQTKWADLNKKQLNLLCNELTQGQYKVNGKSTFKEEFVTAGGIDLKEVNFKNMSSKLIDNLYFAGEILNIDAITGGFNFQNAWTTSFIVAQNFK